jgi:hypothetical protein
VIVEAVAQEASGLIPPRHVREAVGEIDFYLQQLSKFVGTGVSPPGVLSYRRQTRGPAHRLSFFGENLFGPAEGRHCGGKADSGEGENDAMQDLFL